MAALTEAAGLLFEVESPTRGDIEKARRRLDALVGKGLAFRCDGTTGGNGGGTPARWQATSVHESIHALDLPLVHVNEADDLDRSREDVDSVHVPTLATHALTDHDSPLLRRRAKS